MSLRARLRPFIEILGASTMVANSSPMAVSLSWWASAISCAGGSSSANRTAPKKFLAGWLVAFGPILLANLAFEGAGKFAVNGAPSVAAGLTLAPRDLLGGVAVQALFAADPAAGTVFAHPDGRLRAVLGTMGADAQPQVVLQMLVRLLVDGADAGHVVSGGRWILAGGSGFGTWDDVDSVEVVVEEHAPAGWVSGLTERGHRARVGRANFGHAHCIEVVDGGLSGAADPRSVVGEAAGF